MSVAGFAGGKNGGNNGGNKNKDAKGGGFTNDEVKPGPVKNGGVRSSTGRPVPVPKAKTNQRVPVVRQPQLQYAAGGIIWRQGVKGVEVALVHRPRYRDWSWPKGKLENGEELSACAVRELAEEIGQEVLLGCPFPVSRRRFSSGVLKLVSYWEGRLLPQKGAAAVRTARPPWELAPNNEIDEVAWVGPLAAQRLLTYAQDRAILKSFMRRYEAGQHATTTLVIMRHAKAMKRGDWQGEEADRPLLAGVGDAQSVQIASHLAAFGVSELWTSPWRRCVDTVAPYVQLCQGKSPQATAQVVADMGTIETKEAATGAVGNIEAMRVAGTGKLRYFVTPALSEQGCSDDPQAVQALLDALVARAADTGRVIGICTHRPVLKVLWGHLRSSTAAAGGGKPRQGPGGVASVLAQLPPTDPYQAAGEIAVVQFNGQRLIGVEYWLTGDFEADLA